MKLKGDWDSGTTYAVGDVVRYTNGGFYVLQSACLAGVTPIDTHWWGPVDQVTGQAASFAMDIAALIPKNIDDEGIILKSGDDEYLVSVDASGDDPEVIATLIEEEEES